MGRTPKKLQRVICVTDPVLRESTEIQALAAKGHTILAWEAVGNMTQPDLIIGSNCRMVVPETVKYVGLALKELNLAKAPTIKLDQMTLEEAPVVEEDDDELPVG